VEERSDRIAALAGLRFAAALGILLFHYGAPLVAGLPGWVERVRAGGHVWVGLFYLLSGFVLARAHPTPMGPAQRRAFWASRLARLYPAYLLAFVLSAPFALERWEGGGPAGAAKAAVVATAALLMLQAWAPPIARAWNAPGWSTSAVAAFYAAFPFAAAWLSRRSRGGLLLAFAGAWALSLAFPLLWLATGPDGPSAGVRWDWNEPAWLEALKFHPVARAGEFLAGVALAGGGGALGRALGSDAARRLGDASFALYVLQEPLWRIARAFAPDPSAPPSAGFVVAFGLAAIGASLAVAALVERPARRALRAWLGRPRTAPAPAGAARQA
jgi:peptidoglycan/LPS O-acetylase OafA/YrhL